MNINLSKAKDGKNKKALGYGLNSRKPQNVFGEDDDSESADDDKEDGRAAVNRELRAEQEALQKRAAEAAAAAASTEYDYDGVYDSMHPAQETKKKEPERKSRYIGDLLQAAKRRERERDIIYEKKISKEQAQEEAEYEGKEKFVTQAYKRKLAERELWAQEEEARRLEEEQQDVTKKSTDGAFASFYGNLNRNVAMGGQEVARKNGKDEAMQETTERPKEGSAGDAASERSADEGLSFADGFELSTTASNTQGGQNDSKSEPAAPVKTMRELRAEKVAKARLRYFQRQGLSEEAIVQKQ